MMFFKYLLGVRLIGFRNDICSMGSLDLGVTE